MLRSTWRGDLLDGLDVATEAHHGEVDDGVDAGRLELLEALDGLRHLVARSHPVGQLAATSGERTKTCSCMRVVPSCLGVDRTAHRVDLSHMPSQGVVTRRRPAVP